MISIAQLQPLQRQALPVLLRAPNNELVRCCGGYRPNVGPDPAQPVFTKRTVNRLEADGLVDFDDRRLPSRVTLTPLGSRLAVALAGDA